METLGLLASHFDRRWVDFGIAILHLLGHFGPTYMFCLMLASRSYSYSFRRLESECLGRKPFFLV